MFVDNATVVVKAGDGGNGIVSFHHARGLAKGGPDGGDGGHGGNVVFVASNNQNTLANFRFQKELHAENGGNGANSKRHGKSGKDLIVKVPVGTQLSAKDDIIADFTQDGQEQIIVRGGKGGFGNAHFISSTRQAPKIAEKGDEGEELTIELELKIIADVGLVGLPNAGKSTLLSRISSAKPKIANYPFTTLNPHLGVVHIDNDSELLVADIPGLIEGASEGKGLGDDFLRHVERTEVLLHLIDVYSDDVLRDYKTILQELKNYKIDLSMKPQVIALSKIEGLDTGIVEDQRATLEKFLKGKKVHTFSSLSGAGLKEVLFELLGQVKETKAHRKSQESEEDKRAVITARPVAEDRWEVEVDKKIVIIRGSKIERFAKRTDFESEDGVRRLRDIMQKLGIMKDLEKRDIPDNARIYFGDDRQDYMEY